MMLAGAVMGDLLRSVSGVATGSLIAAVWQGALLAGAAALGLKLLPKTPAAARFAIWFSVFVLVAALPFASLWAHPGHSGVALNAHPAWFVIDARWSEGVLLFWAAASLVRASTLLVGAARVRALWKKATPVHLAGIAGADASVLGRSVLGRKVQICTAEEIDRPSVIGFFAPKILIPAWLVEKLTPEEMEQVVLHEAGHLRRADDWLNLLQKVALVVFPLNPALAWVERRLCFERELACDDRVLKATGAAKAYASCLTSLAEHRITRRGMSLVMGALGRESELGQRVRRILARGDHMRPVQARLVMGSAVLVLVAGAAGLERCPQLVGFGSARRDVLAAAPLTRGASYNNVVYRPFSPAAGRVRAFDAVVRTPVSTPGTPAKLRAGRQHVRPGKTAVPAVHPAGQQQPLERRVSSVSPIQNQPRLVSAGWVVMTTWSTEMPGYGTRIVMSSFEMVPESPAGVPEALAAQPREIRTVVPAARPDAQEIFPYAAVPVRGGWLVIQL